MIRIFAVLWPFKSLGIFVDLMGRTIWQCILVFFQLDESPTQRSQLMSHDVHIAILTYGPSTSDFVSCTDDGTLSSMVPNYVHSFRH